MLDGRSSWGADPRHECRRRGSSLDDRDRPDHAWKVLETYAADLREAKAEHERIATDAAARLRESGRAVDVEVRAGDAAEEIIAVVEQQRADLVVLGSRGRTGLTRLLLGSVARNVLSGSTASVLIVRDGTEEVS